MIREDFPSAREILSEELKSAGWHEQTEPSKLFDTLDACMERTYEQVRSACWGNKMRTMVCDVLFREAQTSVDLARASVESLSISRVSTQGKRENRPDWIQPTLLLLGAVLGLLGSIHGINFLRIFLGILGAMCVLGALIREFQRLLHSGIALKLLQAMAKLLKKAKWLKLLLKRIDAKPRQEAQSEMMVEMNAEALEEICLRQMDVIDSNLGLFHDPAQQKDQGGMLLPLAQILLQEKYARGDVFPEAVEAELMQYLRANSLRIVDYDAQHASFFQTQPMEETFTIYPAILDGEGRVVEYGVAGVREE